MINSGKNIIKIDNLSVDTGFSKSVYNADAVKCKLTPKQNMILYCLQNGWSLITSSEYSNVCIGNDKGQFWFTGALFWRMVNMGFIYQQSRHPHWYVLTELGNKVITKKVDIDKWM